MNCTKLVGAWRNCCRRSCSDVPARRDSTNWRDKLRLVPNFLGRYRGCPFIVKNAPVICRRVPQSLRREKDSALFRHCLVALRFQLGVLISRKDGLGLFHEDGATFLGAPILHALLLPGRQFRILVGRQIQTRQVHATAIRGLHVFAATSFPTGKGRACRQ